MMCEMQSLVSPPPILGTLGLVQDIVVWCYYLPLFGYLLILDWKTALTGLVLCSLSSETVSPCHSYR